MKTSNVILLPILTVMLLLSVGGTDAPGATERTWNGAANGDWFSAVNWLPSDSYPQAGDTAVVTNGSVLLTGDTASLAALTITNATLVFSNWTTTLIATNVQVRNGAILTHVTNTASASPWTETARVDIECADFLLETGGTLFADGRGYTNYAGPGRGGNGNGSGGGGHGGWGGRGRLNTDGAGGGMYGLTNAPVSPGSGGGYNTFGTAGVTPGGGAIRIMATGSVTINGTVTANGRTGGSLNGGGAGGSIYMSCVSFGGNTNGILQANGGDGKVTSAGGGGGGRIAVDYQSLIGTPGVRFSVNCGVVTFQSMTLDPSVPTDLRTPHMGTLYFSKPDLLNSVVSAWGGVATGINGYVFFGSTNVWNPGSVTLQNSTLGIPTGYTWRVTSDLNVSTSRLVVANYATLAVGGNLTLTNGSGLILYGGQTNASVPTTHGVLLAVTNTLTVYSNSWIYPYSHSTNGGSALIRAANVNIRAGGGIDANGRGYTRKNGPGKGATSDAASTACGGGGYGGRGGGTNVLGSGGGGVNGMTNAPLSPGSGGGGTSDGISGGGLIRIEASGTVTLDGTLSANGGSDNYAGSNVAGGGGSGGGIYVLCTAFSGGGSGILRANGADGDTYSAYTGGGGGGGRIAIWAGVPEAERALYLGGDTNEAVRAATHKNFDGNVYVNPGTGGTGAESGTAFFFTPKALRGSVISFR